MCKIFSFNMVVCFNKDLPEDGLSNWVVLGVKLVKAMKRVSILIPKKEKKIINSCRIMVKS